MNLYQQFQTDAKKEIEGTWIPLSATARIKVAREGNPRHQACLKRLTAPYLKPGIRTNDIPDDTWEAVTREAAAETLLVDWEGIVNDANEPVPYSKAEALAALAMKDFYRLVLMAAQSMETFRVARQAELSKN